MKLNVSSSPELVQEGASNNVTTRRTEDCSATSWKATTSTAAGDLQDSTSMTSPTETGSISEDEGSLGWLGGITADFKTLAFTLKETAGGVANFVQRSAMAVASEIAHLEEEELVHRQQQERQQQQNSEQCVYEDDNGTLRLPWEIECGDDYQEDEGLKDKIQGLSTKEDTFLRPYSTKDEILQDNDDDNYDDDDNYEVDMTTRTTTKTMRRPPFVLDEPRIELVRRLLTLDDKLAAMHARLSGRSDIKETIFWQNYFYNVEWTREEYFVLLPPPPPSIHTMGTTTVTTSVMARVAPMESFDDDLDNDDNNVERSNSNDKEDEEDGSFVQIPSPPPSQLSVGSLVMIDAGIQDKML